MGIGSCKAVRYNADASRSSHLSVACWSWWCMDNSLGLRPKAGFFAREREGVGGGKVDAPGVEVFMGNTSFVVISLPRSTE